MLIFKRWFLWPFSLKKNWVHNLYSNNSTIKIIKIIRLPCLFTKKSMFNFHKKKRESEQIDVEINENSYLKKKNDTTMIFLSLFS